MAAPAQTPAQATWRSAALNPAAVVVPGAHYRLPAPSATFRIQFSPSFGFAAARRLLPALQQLGITDVYLSPIFRPRRGSLHGYDIIDPLQFNPELGAAEEFDELARDAAHHGMGLILDIVPNHMAACAENPWWADVLEEGRNSEFAHYFDIDWKSPGSDRPDKLVLPALGSSYLSTLVNQELRLALDESGLAIRYYEHRFPLRLESYKPVLTNGLAARTGRLGASHPAAAALAHLLETLERPPDGLSRSRISEKRAIRNRLWRIYREHDEARRFIDDNLRRFNGVKGDAVSFAQLDGLLGRQAYELCCWREARNGVNYRRFFDINELVGVRVEDEDVFEATHALVFRLVEERKARGVRIDHLDGLRDPVEYLERLRDGFAARNRPDCIVVAEKVLLGGETLDRDWQLSGTTGYDFLNAANGVFVDGEQLKRLGEIYGRFTGIEGGFGDLARAQKKRVMAELFCGELRKLAARLEALAARDPEARRCALADFKAAIEEVTACLPVYRTYIRAFEVPPSDLKAIGSAFDALGDGAALAFLKRVLLLDFEEQSTVRQRDEWLEFVMQWQQFTGPVMAKGMEDTACYVYNRLASLNEVGGESKATPVGQFHAFNAARRRRWRLSFNATSSHDTKRSEDVRARINVISEIPDLWEESLERWRELNRDKKRGANGIAAPCANDEVLLYQTLLGAWPLNNVDRGSFGARIRDYMRKAAREAKLHTNWYSPDEEYERALVEFSDRILDPAPDNLFLADLLRLQVFIAPFGAIGSLAQALLKIGSPGVPDFYQGTTLWDFSLVDPDNRRPVDFGRQARALAEACSPRSRVEDLIENWQDGRIKLYLISKALAFRRAHPDLFLAGDYRPIEASGPARKHLIAFTRGDGRAQALIVVPRLLVSLCRGRDPFRTPEAWSDTVVELPRTAPYRWRNVFTGERLDGDRLAAAEILGRFPVALLSAVDEGPRRVG